MDTSHLDPLAEILENGMEPMEIIETYQQTMEYVAHVAIEENQFDSLALWEEAQKMGLELGDLEDYGFSKSAKCGGYCFPKNMSGEEMETAVDKFVDRFS